MQYRPTTLSTRCEKSPKQEKLTREIYHVPRTNLSEGPYWSPVRTHLDYCDIIYHIPALNSRITLGVTLSSLMEKVERIQYQAALAITGTWQGSNRANLYEELGWETLSDRRSCMRILHTNKITCLHPPSDNITPSSLR